MKYPYYQVDNINEDATQTALNDTKIMPDEENAFIEALEYTLHVDFPVPTIGTSNYWDDYETALGRLSDAVKNESGAEPHGWITKQGNGKVYWDSLSKLNCIKDALCIAILSKKK